MRKLLFTEIMSYLKGWKKCLFTQKQKGSLRIKTVLKPNVFQSEDLSSYATYCFLEYFDNLVEYLPKKIISTILT